MAASSGHADTARLFVRALRSVVVAPADTVVTAVGDSFDLHATAYDNFGAVLATGFTQTFVSASPNVTTVSATGRIHSVGPGNGVIVVKDSVDSSLKVQSTATVRINQVTAGIVNVPMPVSVVDVTDVGVAVMHVVGMARRFHGSPLPYSQSVNEPEP